MSTIKHLSISGFKSIRHLERLPLGSLNVLIGANGAGKSNFVDYFRMLPELIKGRLQRWSSKQGGAERILSFGSKETSALTTVLSSKTVCFALNWFRAIFTQIRSCSPHYWMR